MALIQRMSRGALTLRADVTGAPAPWDDYWYSPIGFTSAGGVRVNADSAKRLAAVLACVGVISRNIGMMPIKIYTEAPDGSKKVVAHHPVYDVLYSRPNNEQTAYEFKQMMEAHVELRGNAYAKIVPGPRGPIDQLIPMHPDRVTVERILPSGRLRYVYRNPLTNETERLMQEEVFHLRNFSDDGATGQSTVALMVDVFGTALARQDYAARFLKNDARPPFVFEGANFKTKQSEQDFIDSWQRGHTAANRGKGGLLPPGVSIKELGIKPIDAELIDQMKFSRIEICSIFGVPPHLIGETEKTATYASVEQFNIMYATHCILPRIVMWEQAIQRDLILSDRYFAKFSMAALLRGDTAARFAAYQIAIQNGWMSQDDVRALEDLNPIPNGAGKQYWRNSAWVPLDQPAPMPAAALPSQTETDDEQADDNGADGATDEGQACWAATERLKLLAAAGADRCMRKEISALRKMVARGTSDYDLEQFYAEQLRFTGEALGLDTDQLTAVRQEYFERARNLGNMLSVGDKAAAFEYIEGLAVRGTKQLAAIAAEGAVR